jgi:hypothetical protein
MNMPAFAGNIAWAIQFCPNPAPLSLIQGNAGNITQDDQNNDGR